MALLDLDQHAWPLATEVLRRAAEHRELMPSTSILRTHVLQAERVERNGLDFDRA